MNYNKIRQEILERLKQNFEYEIDHLNIEDIEDCVGDIISTYGIELEDVENMMVYESNYSKKIDALSHDGIHIEELGEE